MLYFYTIKALGQEMYASGVVKCNSRIETVDEFSNLNRELQSEVVKVWNNKFPDLQITESDVVLTAFNPL